jgi:hypothetical protein
MPFPCRAAKGLEYVFPIWFTQCGRVWFTLAMCHAPTVPFFSRPQHCRLSTAVLCCGLENGMVRAWHGHGMTSVNQTRPHCVNQMGKTHSKLDGRAVLWPWEEGMDGAWHGHGVASENQTRPHCVNQMGKTHSKPLAARNGRETAWARHAMCESVFRRLCVNFMLLMHVPCIFLQLIHQSKDALNKIDHGCVLCLYFTNSICWFFYWLCVRWFWGATPWSVRVRVICVAMHVWRDTAQCQGNPPVMDKTCLHVSQDCSG